MQKRRKKDVKPSRGARFFGDMVTCDLMTPYKDKLDGVDSSKIGILFYDLATGWLEFFTLPDKTSESIGLGIRRFANKGTIKFMYSDRDPAIVEACRELKILHDVSLPGRAETNSLIERQVGGCLARD